jgi:hypothetical protein
MNMLIRLVLLFMLFLTSQSGIATMNIFTTRKSQSHRVPIGEAVLHRMAFNTTPQP